MFAAVFTCLMLPFPHSRIFLCMSDPISQLGGMLAALEYFCNFTAKWIFSKFIDFFRGDFQLIPKNFFINFAVELTFGPSKTIFNILAQLPAFPNTFFFFLRSWRGLQEWKVSTFWCDFFEFSVECTKLASFCCLFRNFCLFGSRVCFATWHTMKLNANCCVSKNFLNFWNSFSKSILFNVSRWVEIYLVCRFSYVFLPNSDIVINF